MANDTLPNHNPYGQLIPSYGSLSQDEREAFEDIQAEVNAALYTTPEDQTSRFLESQPYTATAFAQIASWLTQANDHDGAELVERFARDFARYEATVITERK
jgi:hypothetical protein